MKFDYVPKGVCSRMMHFDIEDNVIVSASVEGGCNGNLQGVCRLIEGKNAQDVISILEGIHCGAKNTSCPDQIAQALKAFLQERA